MAPPSSRLSRSIDTRAGGKTGWNHVSREVRAQLRKLASLKGELRAELDAIRSFQWANERLLDSSNFYAALSRSLLASMNITGADFGNLQLLDETTGTLRIVAQQGFGPRFLEFFGAVHSGQATCGTAMKSLRSVYVKDVTASPIFRDNETLEVMLDAEARSVRSFPLIAASGRLVGVMSSLYRAETPCTHDQIFVAESLAKHVANFIERSEVPSTTLRSLSNGHSGQI